jgi:antitoxin component YwqK of YwqJK toxin-antitoxin module
MIWEKGRYVNGYPDGLFEIYYCNGSIHSKGNYINGEREGLWEYYDENGRGVRYKKVYKEGGLI